MCFSFLNPPPLLEQQYYTDNNSNNGTHTAASTSATAPITTIDHRLFARLHMCSLLHAMLTNTLTVLFLSKSCLIPLYVVTGLASSEASTHIL